MGRKVWLNTDSQQVALASIDIDTLELTRYGVNESTLEKKKQLEKYMSTALFVCNELQVLGVVKLNSDSLSIRWIPSFTVDNDPSAVKNVSNLFGDKIVIHCDSVDDLTKQKCIKNLRRYHYTFAEKYNSTFISKVAFKEILDNHFYPKPVAPEIELDKDLEAYISEDLPSKLPKPEPKQEQAPEIITETLEESLYETSDTLSEYEKALQDIERSEKYNNKKSNNHSNNIYVQLIPLLREKDSISIPKEVINTLSVNHRKILSMNNDASKIIAISEIKLNSGDVNRITAVTEYDDASEYVRVIVLNTYDFKELSVSELNSLEVKFNNSKKEHSYINR
jgi:hypothetical protein